MTYIKPPSESSSKQAVGEGLMRIMLDHRLNSQELATAIGCSRQTIENALSGKHKLNLHLVGLARWAFGDEYFAALDALYRKPAPAAVKLRGAA